MVVKLSASGSVIWSLQTGGVVNDRFNGAIELSDNSYLLYGVTESFGYNQGKILLCKVSNSGSIIWSRQFGTTSTIKEQLNSLMQFSDGDLIGIFNINDSTNVSDPVVFKIGLDGTLRWARRFENGGEESLTSIAFDSNTIFVSGFYKTGKRRGVLTKINSSDGNLISSLNIYHSDSTYDQEMTYLEVLNNTLSYGLNIKKNVGNYILNKTLMIQSDLNGINKTFETTIENNDDTSYFFFKRTPENAFAFLRNRYSPEIIKLNIYNQIEWSTLQTANSFNVQKNFGMDITHAGGTVSAGYYKNYLTGYLNKMAIIKTNSIGKIGSCSQTGSTFFTDTITQKQALFT